MIKEGKGYREHKEGISVERVDVGIGGLCILNGGKVYEVYVEVWVE